MSNAFLKKTSYFLYVIDNVVPEHAVVPPEKARDFMVTQSSADNPTRCILNCVSVVTDDVHLVSSLRVIAYVPPNGVTAVDFKIAFANLPPSAVVAVAVVAGNEHV